MASVWELQIKILKGKLRLSRPIGDVIRMQSRTNGLTLLEIHPEHILTLEQLPNHHADPFDRLFIAQAIYENIPVVTPDGEFARYGINVIW